MGAPSARHPTASATRPPPRAHSWATTLCRAPRPSLLRRRMRVSPGLALSHPSAESCPKPSAACKKSAKACDANKQCAAAKAKGGTKGIVDVGCHGGKGGLNAFFAWAADCCDPKNIGFSDNIPMFKMQITSMPVYKDSGTHGRFKANRGAGSVCTMVKSLAAGMASGDDGGVLLEDANANNGVFVGNKL